MTSLWGEEFNIDKDEKKLLKKVKTSKEVSSASVNTDSYTAKAISRLPLNEQLDSIKKHVEDILAVYKDNITVIRSVDELHTYIDKAVVNGDIALDAETDHSLDPITCTLMGVCIYTSGLKSAYIPINHWDYRTQERYKWQCTEQEVKQELDRLVQNKTKIIYHNADFDYRVIHCTCKCDLTIDWDTMTGARILNENERASLKGQYAAKIDPSVEKYSVDTFFKDIDYRNVPVETFALYAATDAYLTYKLYRYQLTEFNKPENSSLLELMYKVELPIIPVVARMELTGMRIDKRYAKTLSDFYHKQVEEADGVIAEELTKLKPLIDKWRLTAEANYKPLKKAGTGEGKSKSEQLREPVEVTSPTQLAILIYDVLKYSSVSKKSPRGTGEDIIEKITAKHNFPLGQAILHRRGLDKLLGTYLDKIPAETHADSRIRASINPLGADTGRFSISNPSLQNIPSEHKEVRLMFEASLDEGWESFEDSSCILKSIMEVNTPQGWVNVKNVKVGDLIEVKDGFKEVQNIQALQKGQYKFLLKI